MSKRRKAPILENELSISKAKKSLRRKTQLTGENHLETQAQHTDRNVLCTSENAAQNTMASSESLELMNLSVTKVEDAGYQGNLQSEELCEIEMQDQDRIRRVNNDDSNSGFVDAHQRIGTEPNLQASICENKMPEEQVSFFLYAPDNEDVDELEKRKFSLKSLKCPLVKEMRVSMLEEDRITGHTKSNQNEEDHLSSLDMGMEQNKAIQDIIKSDNIQEANWTKNGSRKVVGLECMVCQPQEENSITQLPPVTDLSVSMPGEQSNYPCTHSVASQGSTDFKEANQSHPYRNGKTEGQNDICSSTEISEPGATVSEKVKDGHNLWTTEKVVEQSGRDRISVQSSPCRRETNVAEQNSVKDQDVSWKVLPDIQSGFIYLRKEADISEPKCEQVIVRNDLLFPQPDGDVQSEDRKISVQDVVYRKDGGRDEKEIGMKASLAKTTTASPDPEVPVLLTQQQQKENNCENLVSNIKQPESDRFDLRPNEIMEALSNTGIAQQTLAKIPKAETKTKLTENSLSSTNIHLDGKEEMLMCVGKKNKSVRVESGLSSVEVLPTLVGVGDPNREHTDLDTQRSLLASGTCPSMTAPSGLDAGVQTCSPCMDPLSLDLEFLPDSQLQGIFESHNCEFSPHKTPFLDNPHTHSTNKSDRSAAEKQNGARTLAPVVDITHQNNARDMVMERICDPSKQQDATDVVCGLIKELSNLNRLIMGTQRDLDSFKRLKFRRNRQPGKLLPLSMNNMTSTLCTVKKRREL